MSGSRRHASAGRDAGARSDHSPIGEIYRYTLESTAPAATGAQGPPGLGRLSALKQVPGVADVTLFGGETVQFQLVVDPAKLTQYGLGLRDVENAITTNNANAGGSVLVTGEQGSSSAGSDKSRRWMTSAISS